jgi:hypothetical protein
MIDQSWQSEVASKGHTLMNQEDFKGMVDGLREMLYAQAQNQPEWAARFDYVNTYFPDFDTATLTDDQLLALKGQARFDYVNTYFPDYDAATITDEQLLALKGQAQYELNGEIADLQNQENAQLNAQLQGLKNQEAVQVQAQMDAT